MNIRLIVTITQVKEYTRDGVVMPGLQHDLVAYLDWNLR